MISFDAEDDGRGNIFLMGFYDGYKYTAFETKKYKDLNAFRKAVIDFIINAGHNIFVAHNLEYDLSHIFQNDYLTCIDWYYSNSLIFCKFCHTKIRFIDSFHFSYAKLADLGKQIKHDKQSIDIKNIFELYQEKPEKVLYYNQVDCEIVYKYMTAFYTTLESEFGAAQYDKDIHNAKSISFEKKNTLASVSQAIFLKHFSDWNNIVGINYNESLLKSYYGGRVECFYTGEINTTIYEIDVNSMYPYVMQFLFPTGEYFKTIFPVSKCYISRIKVKIKDDIYLPVLPFRDQKLLFPAGIFETWSTNYEIEKAISEKQIDDIEYLETYNFSAVDYVFKKFVDYFYKRRRAAKNKKNKFESEYYKRILNHLYGRFALHKELKKLTRIKPDNINKVIPVTNTAGYQIVKTNSKSKNFALSIFVTSYARIYLYELLKKLSAFYDILYCDTDSCYFTDLSRQKDIMDVISHINSIFNISNDLGAYSLNAYQSGAFYNSKAYILHKFIEGENLEGDKIEPEKIKLKGIKKENRKEFLKTGQTKYRKPVKMRSALRSVKGKIVNVWDEQDFFRRGEYDKRKVIPVSDSLNRTEPLIIQN